MHIFRIYIKFNLLYSRYIYQYIEILFPFYTILRNLIYEAVRCGDIVQFFFLSMTRF